MVGQMVTGIALGVLVMFALVGAVTVGNEIAEFTARICGG